MDDDGAPLEVDAFWADHGVALALVADRVERWRFAGLLLALRDVRLLVVLADGLPTGDDGRVVRDDDEVRRGLVRGGFPGSREAFDALRDGAAATWTSSTVELQGAYRDADGIWTTAEPGEDDEAPDGPGPGRRSGDDDGDAEVWDGSGGAEEPWIPGWSFERFEEDPWGGRVRWDEDRQAAVARHAAARSVDEDPDDDEERDDAWDDEDRDAGEATGGPNAGEAPVELGWRSRSIALAALGAVVLARRVLAEDRTGDLPPTGLQLLAALAVPDDGEALRDLSNARGLAARLALRETTVQGVTEDLVERGLIETAGDPEQAVELTREGRAALLAWLEGIAPLFGGWAPERSGPDDAS